MRETRLSGSEGGRFEFNRFSLPLLLDRLCGAGKQDPPFRTRTVKLRHYQAWHRMGSDPF